MPENAPFWQPGSVPVELPKFRRRDPKVNGKHLQAGQGLTPVPQGGRVALVMPAGKGRGLFQGKKGPAADP